MKRIITFFQFNWFFTFLIALILIIFANQIFVNYLFSKKFENTKPLIKVEDQRVLSQKIVDGFDKLQKDPTSYNSLLELARYYKKNHYAMINCDKELMFNALKDKECRNLLNDANSKVDYINQILDSKQPVTKEIVEQVVVNQKSYLATLDSFVYVLQENLTKEFLNEQFQHASFAIASLMILILLAKFLVWPIEKRRKIAEVKIKSSDRKLLSLYNSSNECNIFIGLDYKVIYLNKVASDLLKNSFGKDIREGDNFKELILERFEKRLLTSFYKASKGETIVTELQLELPKSNAIKWYHLSFYPVYDFDNELIGVSFVAHDIHQRMLAEAKNATFTSRFEKIAWQQSHMIRAHVANLLGLSDVLMRHELSKTETEKNELIRLINSETKRLDGVVHEIVNLAQVKNVIL